MAKITTIPLFKNRVLTAGTAGTSDVIDLRYCSTQQRFSLFYKTWGGTSSTAGTVHFSYVAAPTEEDIFISPAEFGTFGTSGTGKSESKLINCGTGNNNTIMLAPFIKIIADPGGAGGAGAQTLINAELNVQ